MVQLGLHYLLHCVAAWAALVWQLCCTTVLQCVFSIYDFIAVKYGFLKKKEDRYFLVIAIIVFGLLDQFQSLPAPFSDFLALFSCDNNN